MKQLTIKTKDKILEVIATYHDKELNKDFILYTDKTYNKDGRLNIFYSLYENVDNNIKLIDIKTNEERKIGLMLVKEVINSLYE